MDFSIEVDLLRRLITVTITGIPSPEDVGWIAESVREKILSLGPGKHVTLYDVRGVQVLPQETTDTALRSLRIDAPEMWAERLAFVATTMLTRRQTRRIAEARPKASVFEDIEAARAWLFAEDLTGAG
ncbi:hypothetical protein [Sphingomonas sp. 22176]|uniref:hypothetical protein n=1 Tax=Sphingomonas sp. 22176 TaxID=3453884 RepID=UPI003F846F24